MTSISKIRNTEQQQSHTDERLTYGSKRL